MTKKEIKDQLDRIEDLIIIYNRHGISNRVQALCERAKGLQELLDRPTEIMVIRL